MCSVSAIAISLGAISAANAQSAGGPWQGLYFGAHIGYGWTDMNSVIRNTSTGNIVKQDDNDGVLLGAHVGYNWQFDQAVFGIEADLDNAGWSQSDTGPGTSTTNSGVISSNIDTLGSIRARLGYAMPGSDTLAYITGGLAFVDGDWSAHDSDEATSGVFNNLGGVLGAGIEHRMAQNVSVGLEGLYYMFDDKNSKVNGVTALPSSGVAGDKIELDNIFVLRLRANYHF